MKNKKGDAAKIRKLKEDLAYWQMQARLSCASYGRTLKKVEAVEKALKAAEEEIRSR